MELMVQTTPDSTPVNALAATVEDLSSEVEKVQKSFGVRGMWPLFAHPLSVVTQLCLYSLVCARARQMTTNRILHDVQVERQEQAQREHRMY